MPDFVTEELNRKSGRRWRPAAALAAVVLLGSAAEAGAAETPYRAFLGGWRGTGEVLATDGHKERVTCKATYAAEDDGLALTQSLVCASDSYRFDVECYVVADGRTLQGHWEETTRRVTGNLVGRIVDGAFDGNVVGPSFTAQISVRSNERRQVVTIRPNGGGIVSVEISMVRQR
jgi:hypothetical protein